MGAGDEEPVEAGERIGQGDVDLMLNSECGEEEAERRQAIWWYLLMAGVLILAAETVISNRLSRREKFL